MDLERSKPRLEDGPLPHDRPFPCCEVRDLGVNERQLAAWVRAGALRHPLRGVYHASQLEDSLGLRLACLRLAVPEDAVVTDRSAAWLLGAPMALAPGDHLVVPRASLFRPPGYRLRNKLAASGERMLRPDEVTEIEGLQVTTALRTACDLGRLLRRDQAFAGLDSMLALELFSKAELVERVERYRGYRFVRQLRDLAPDADSRAQSPGESILRRRWLDCSDLPRPEPQLPVPGPWGCFWLDLGVEEIGYGAEYDGAEWHGEEQRQHDKVRRGQMAEHRRYEIDVLRAHNIHGPLQDAEHTLRRGIERARRRHRP